MRHRPRAATVLLLTCLVLGLVLPPGAPAEVVDLASAPSAAVGSSADAATTSTGLAATTLVGNGAAADGLPLRTVAAARDRVLDVQGVLARRSAAVLSGDRVAFLATVDPRAAAQFRSAQGMQFDGLRSLPLSAYAEVVRTIDSGDLAPGLGLASAHGADGAFLAETQERYRLAGYDDRDAVLSRWWTFVQRSGSWYVAADDDAHDIGLVSATAPWDAGPLSAQPTEHFLVIAAPAQAARARHLGDLAEQAMVRFARSWSLPWSQRVPLIVPSDAEQARALLQASNDVGRYSAFVAFGSERDGSGTWRTTAPRMYAQDANLAGQSDAQQVDTIVHELTHAAASVVTGPFTPTWLQEGLAEWVRLGRPGAVAPPTSRVELPEAAAFAGGDLRRSYGLATSAVAALSASYGADAPLRLLVELGARRLQAGSPAAILDGALRSVIGVGVTDFVARWQLRPG